MKQNTSTEPVILDVSKNPLLLMAKTFGKITLGEKKYSYLKNQDALIREDLMKKYSLFIQQKRTWEDFLVAISN
jgi:hypothetical protein